MHKIRYFTKDALVSAAKQAEVNDVNRQIDIKRLEKIVESGILYPITFALVHNETEMRCRVVLNEQGESAFLNVPIEVWQNLPLQEGFEPQPLEVESAPPVS